MTIFDDAVMGPSRGDVEAPKVEDGQYVDGERVDDVQFYRDEEGHVVVIKDRRASLDHQMAMIIMGAIDFSINIEPPERRAKIDNTFGALQ